MISTLQLKEVGSQYSLSMPIGASPGRDYEDGISTKNLVLNVLWCRAGNFIEKGGERSAGYRLIDPPQASV